MIAQRGHFSLIVPDFARRTVSAGELGIYEYAGDHQWQDYSGRESVSTFYIGWWG